MSNQNFSSLTEPLQCDNVGGSEYFRDRAASESSPLTNTISGTSTSGTPNPRKRVSLNRMPVVHDEPVELQIETMNPVAGRVMFYFWYGLLALAIVIQSIITLQWQSVNMCTGTEVSLSDIGSWSSPCATRYNYTSRNSEGQNASYSDVVWEGYIDTSPLARFLHLVFSMRNPNTTFDTTHSVSFGYTITNATDAHSISDINRISTYSISCKANQVRCSTLVMATESTGKVNASLVTLIAVGLESSVANVIFEGSAVGTVNQRKSYTIASIVVRYTLMVFSMLQVARFLYHKKYTSTLYEQTWIGILQAGLFLYLDPLFAAGVYITPEPNVLSFLEFRVPTYFMALMVAFMFSLITSSMSWTSSNGIYDPPLWTKIASIVFLITIFTLDIIDSSKDNWNWNLEHCPNFSCNTMGYFLYGILILGVLICTVWLYWLRDNLGQKPYLDSRPQQLAVRVFILMFSTTVIYFTIQSLTIAFAYRDISGIVTYQALIQIPPILVSVFFVNIMTLVYTTQIRSQRVPIRPSDLRWKKAVWPESWYQWLSRHGGSMYIFFTEAEETEFYEIQSRFAKRRARSLLSEDARHRDTTYDASTEMLVAVEVPTSETDATRSSKITFDLYGHHVPEDEEDEENDDEDRDSLADEEDDDYIDDDDLLDDEAIRQKEAVREAQRDKARREPTSSLLNSPKGSPGVGPRDSVSNVALPLRRGQDGDDDPAGNPRPPTDEQADPRPRRNSTRRRNSVRRRNTIADRIPGGARILDAVASVTRSVSRLVVRAETEIINRTATLIDAVEDRFLDTFNAAMRHKPFFNLELSIDCLNLSWEAYGVAVSAGDAVISTGVNVNIPSVQPAARRTMEFFTSCFSCFGSDTKEQEGGATTDEPLHQVGDDNRESVVTTNGVPQSTSPVRQYGSMALPNVSQASSPTAAVDDTPPINTEQYGYRRIAVHEAEAVQVVISKMDLSCPRHAGKCPRIVVSFRGTNSLENAKQDLNIRRVAWDEAESTLWQSASRSRPSVHEGFLGIWSALRQFVVMAVLEEIQKEPQVPYRVITTGHSMGGAVATLCAFVLQKTLTQLGHPLPDPYVYTYGQPRIGNKSFQKRYNAAVPNTFRVVNESDAVSFITMLGGCHVGMEVDVDRNGNYICEPMFMERTLRPMKGKGSAIANHMLQAYAESLNAIANRVNVCASRCLVAYTSISSGTTTPGESPETRQRAITTPIPTATAASETLRASASLPPEL